MTWTSLQNSLSARAHVLAGPILRKVTTESVTVWVALRLPATVTLELFDASNTAIPPEGRQHTVAIGSHLHIVAVTAKPTKALAEGVIYRYHLVFDFDGGPQGMKLAKATNDAVIAYPEIGRPSFCLPPSDLNQLRLIQGSCRNTNGNSKDAFELVDDLIASNAADAVARPHQLLLTGDQIYADDVAASLLIMLSDAADQLLGWKEVLPVPASHGGPATPLQLPPFLRRSVLADAGFTSVDLDGHLMSLGEYLCMYLFVWSEELWPKPPVTAPSFDEVVTIVTQRREPRVAALWKRFLNTEKKATIEKDISRLAVFRESLWKVRRALANIPCYMIFDDHEVTDDWNMTRAISRGMYGKALGRRIVQNALVAYALCQHWGNAPEQFAFQFGQSQLPVGFELLSLLDKANETTYRDNSPTIFSRVGLKDGAAVEANRNVFHEPNSLRYHFTVEGPAYQIVFTDTRSWRSFPDGEDDPPHLLTRDELTNQIFMTAPLRSTRGDRLLLVVLSTNAPPIQAIRTATRHYLLSNTFEHVPDIFESWELPSAACDRLFKTLTDKLPIVDGEHRGPVILLSGDVHMSFASRMLYKASSRFEEPLPPEGATAVIAQLVASALRNQGKATEGFHREGYGYRPPGTLKRLAAKLTIPAHAPEGYVGWNMPISGQTVGVATLGGILSSIRFLIRDNAATVAITDEGNVMIVSWGPGTPPPDYSYRLDYLLGSAEGLVPPGTITFPAGSVASTPQERKQWADAFHLASRRYRTFNKGRSPGIVGVNNVGELTFDWPAGDSKKVTHTLRWRNDKDVVQFTDFVVSLNPGERGFEEIKPKVRP